MCNVYSMKIVIGEKGHIKQDYYRGSGTYKRTPTGDAYFIIKCNSCATHQENTTQQS